jgi:hypothetical protein
LSQLLLCCLLLTLIVGSVYSNPASVSVFHRIGHLSVLTRCQSLSFFANDLPNVRDGSYCDLPNVQDELDCDLPSVQDEPYHDSESPTGSERDKPCQPEYYPLVMFGQNINASRAGTCVESHVLPANLKHFSEYSSSVKQFVHILSQRISCCWLLLTGRLAPILHLLVRFLSNVYTVFEYAYISPENQCCAAVLVHVETMRFFLRSHDFAALQWRTGQKLLRIHYSLLYNLSRRKISYFRTSTTCPSLRGVRMQSFFVGHRRPIFSSRVLNLPFPLSLSSPTDTLPSKCHFGGGGKSRFPCASILPYIVSKPSFVNEQNYLQYVAYVDNVGLNAYPSDTFVYADIPLPKISQLLSITFSRYIATMHGIAVGLRCTVAQLKTNVDEHTCLGCPSYIAVFSVVESVVESELAKQNMVRVRKHREKHKPEAQTAALKDSGKSEHPQSVEFPPLPCSINFEHTIIKDACRRMDPVNFEEVGCAVCGELRRRDKASRLKSVKNFLNILDVPGITRIERATDTVPIKEFKGPVLDYSCSHICDTCRADVHRGKVPRLALARGLWLGKVPPQLSCLTFVEKLLVAKVRHTCAFVKVASGMRKMKANIVAFESPVPKIYNILPPPCDDLDDMLAILFTGPCKPTKEDFARTPFLVRRNAVINALDWLKLNHGDYADIEISHANAMQYDDDMPPVSVEYRPSETNKVPEGTSVFDNDEDDAPWKVTVHLPCMD